MVESTQHPSGGVTNRWLRLAGQIIAIILVTLLLLEGALRFGFHLTPPTFQAYLIDNLPPRDLPANIGEMAWALREFPSSVNDTRARIVSYQPAVHNDLYLLTCASPSADDLEEIHTVTYDVFGFRQDQTYPLLNHDPDVIVLGDSFGATHTMQYPFWQGVSERVWGLSVSNSGLTEQANILRAVLQSRDVAPQVIVIPYFEGNDLSDHYFYPQQATVYVPPTPPQPALLNRLYVAQMVSFARQRVRVATAPPPAPPPVESVLPEDAPRIFDMRFDPSVTADGDPYVYTEGYLPGWAFDSRDGQMSDIGISRVSLHAGETCDAPLVSTDQDAVQASVLTYPSRPDVAAFFELPLDSVYAETGFALPVNIEAGLQPLTVCAQSQRGDVFSRTQTVDVRPCPFPLMTTTGHEIVFSPRYLAAMTLDTDEINQSESLTQVQSALLDIQAQANTVGADVLLLYLPSKIHAYENVITDDELLQMDTLLNAFEVVAGDSLGEFGPVPGLNPADVVARLRNNLSDQRTVIERFADEQGIDFVDATPALQAAVADGQMPFHAGDTHTNDLGADIIREVLRAALVPYLAD